MSRRRKGVSKSGSRPVTTSPAPASSSRRWRQIWPYLALALLAFGVYATTLGNGFVWDDSAQLLKNPAVIDFRKIPSIFGQDVWAFERQSLDPQEPAKKSNYYRPIQILMYMGVYSLAGFSSVAFHLLMVLLHCANTLLVYYLACCFLGNLAPWREAALVAGALFAVHPIHTEAVAWIAALPDVLLTLFVLMSLTLFIRWQATVDRWRIAVLATLFLAALLTKETGIALLPLLLGFEWLYLGRGPREIWKNRALYGSLLGAFGIYLAMRIHALGSLAPAQGRNVQFGGWEFALNAIVLMGRYLAKLIWPSNLSSYHAFEPLSSLNLLVILSIAALIGIGAAIVLFRGTLPVVSFASFFVLIALVPAMNLNGIGDAIFAERYLYLPSAGFVWIAGLLWFFLWKSARTVAWIAAVAVLTVFSYSVMARTPDWHDDIRLYTVTARQYPNSAPVRTMLAQYYQFHGDTGQAIAEYRAAIHLRPGNAILHNSLATLLSQRGNSQEAIAEFEKAVALDPGYWPALVNLAMTLDHAGAAEKAAAAFERALRLKPDSVYALNGLAVIRRAAKNYPAAIELLGRAVAVDPKFTEGYLNFGLVYFDQAKYTEAALAFRKAIDVGEQYPNLYLAHYGLGVSYARLNQLQEAAGEFGRTLQLNPGYAPAREALERVRALIK